MERSLFKEIYPHLGYSRYRYSIPITLENYQVFPRSPEHKGAFKNAVDILVPNPNETQTIIYSPISGMIRFIEMSNKVWGTTPNHKKYLNYIHIQVDQKEFVELCHVAPYEEGGVSRILRLGQIIEQGEPIAIVGLNGRITKTNEEPDSHLHIMVGEWIKPGEFRSLKIRWNQPFNFKFIE